MTHESRPPEATDVKEVSIDLKGIPKAPKPGKLPSYAWLEYQSALMYENIQEKRTEIKRLENLMIAAQNKLEAIGFILVKQHGKPLTLNVR